MTNVIADSLLALRNSDVDIGITLLKDKFSQYKHSSRASAHPIYLWIAALQLKSYAVRYPDRDELEAAVVGKGRLKEYLQTAPKVQRERLYSLERLERDTGQRLPYVLPDDLAPEQYSTPFLRQLDILANINNGLQTLRTLGPSIIQARREKRFTRKETYLITKDLVDVTRRIQLESKEQHQVAESIISSVEPKTDTAITYDPHKGDSMRDKAVSTGEVSPEVSRRAHNQNGLAFDDSILRERDSSKSSRQNIAQSERPTRDSSPSETPVTLIRSRTNPSSPLLGNSTPRPYDSALQQYESIASPLSVSTETTEELELELPIVSEVITPDSLGFPDECNHPNDEEVNSSMDLHSEEARRVVNGSDRNTTDIPDLVTSDNPTTDYVVGAGLPASSSRRTHHNVGSLQLSYDATAVNLRASPDSSNNARNLNYSKVPSVPKHNRDEKPTTPNKVTGIAAERGVLLATGDPRLISNVDISHKRRKRQDSDYSKREQASMWAGPELPLIPEASESRSIEEDDIDHRPSRQTQAASVLTPPGFTEHRSDLTCTALASTSCDELHNILQSLEPGVQLTDNVIAKAFEILAPPSVKVVHPLWLRVEDQSDTFGTPFRSQFPIYLVPVLYSGHWTVAIVDTTVSRIYHYDSLKSYSAQWSQKLRNALVKFAQANSNNVSWEFTDEPCPQQQNGTDCGVFAVAAGIHKVLLLDFPDSIDVLMWRLLLRLIFLYQLHKGSIDNSSAVNSLLSNTTPRSSILDVFGLQFPADTSAKSIDQVLEIQTRIESQIYLALDQNVSYLRLLQYSRQRLGSLLLVCSKAGEVCLEIFSQQEGRIEQYQQQVENLHQSIHYVGLLPDNTTTRREEFLKTLTEDLRRVEPKHQHAKCLKEKMAPRLQILEWTKGIVNKTRLEITRMQDEATAALESLRKGIVEIEEGQAQAKVRRDRLLRENIVSDI